MTEHQTPPAMRALKATYDEARAGREAAEALGPLLALLEPPEPGETGPLAEVTDLLTAILKNQEATLKAIEALVGHVDAGHRKL